MKTGCLCASLAALVLASATNVTIGADQARIYKAASYKPGGDTGVDFQGTGLMPKASGRAVISNKGGSVRIKARFE